MLKKNCHQVLRSQKSKLTPIELVFETAGAINPPPTKIGLTPFPDILELLPSHIFCFK